jgi:ubiquinone biosynthesis protein COQ4
MMHRSGSPPSNSFPADAPPAGPLPSGPLPSGPRSSGASRPKPFGPGSPHADTRPNRIRPFDALHALRVLARSGGTDYCAAAAFMSATEGRSGQRAFARFQASPSGAQLLQQRPSLRRMLGRDRHMLSVLPQGTLGRTYYKFMSANGSSAEGMAELGQVGRPRPMTDAETWFTERMNTLHDVRHVVAGYGQDPLGELCLVAFRFAQSRHPGMAFLAVAWGLKTARARRDQPIVSAVMEGYRRGRAALWMDDLDWEQMLQEPLAAVRSRLRLDPPAVYDRIAAAIVHSGLSRAEPAEDAA